MINSSGVLARRLQPLAGQWGRAKSTAVLPDIEEIQKKLAECVAADELARLQTFAQDRDVLSSEERAALTSNLEQLAPIAITQPATA